LRSAIDADIQHHRLLRAERELLQETLVGGIKAVVDILAITHPVAFGRTTRVTRLATDLAAATGKQGFWQLEAAAMLSQIGYVSLPTELIEKLYYCKRLTSEERALADGAPQLAQKLIRHIPRLDYDAHSTSGLPISESIAAIRAGPVKHDTALLEGLESMLGAGGAGSIESALLSDTTDLTLLLICAVLPLTVAGIGVADELRPKAFAKRPYPLNQG
jgi:hypothetical protein